MPNDAPRSHAQQFEHAIATAFTCRSIVKYNSSLSEEQKSELIADLDTTLKFLGERLIANSSIEAEMVLSPLSLAGLIPAENSQEDDSDENVDNKPGDEPILRGLYKIYHTYLHAKQGTGPDEFTARYSEVMSIIDEVQKIIEKSHDTYPTYIGDLLHSVRGFIADLYVIFREFSHAITLVLQRSDIYIDTEEVSSMQKQEAESAAKPADLASLKRIYETHRQLNEKKGALASRVGEATAFLIFLEESLDSNLNKRDEVTAQLNNVAILLGDLAYLLADYEKVTSALLEPGRQ
ncbi:MAG TPA: hypothetical protein VKP04_00785 [Ktedonobacteraceae bacterium]|nr:hypothetical protein [Ktedonobacteraceae bacterium]